MIKKLSIPYLLSEKSNINNKETEAVIKIQKIIYSYFYRKYGSEWKKEIKQKKIRSDYDYYCYRNNIIDPWHDYQERLEYQYSKDKYN
jgi:hypothetical protein